MLPSVVILSLEYAMSIICHSKMSTLNQGTLTEGEDGSLHSTSSLGLLVSV